MRLSIPPHVVLEARETFDRARFLFELIGAAVVGAWGYVIIGLLVK